MGFDVINKLSEKYNITVQKKGLDSLYGTGIIENKKVILVKPQTYMNISGVAIRKFTEYYKIDNSKLIIIYDDIDIEPGTVKIRKKGGAGTHNGMKSVISELETNDFIHIRIGTGKPEFKSDLINYVIGKLSQEDYFKLQNAIDIGTEAVEQILRNGIDNAMNYINAK